MYVDWHCPLLAGAAGGDAGHTFRDLAGFLAVLIAVSPSLHTTRNPMAGLLSCSFGGGWAGSKFTLLCLTLGSTYFSPMSVVFALSFSSLSQYKSYCPSA